MLMRLFCVHASTALLLSTSFALGNEPLRITVRHDSYESGAAAQVVHFGALGEPLAYIDWLCVETSSDLGESLMVDLRDLAAMGDEGQRVGHFVSASGNTHSFRAFHHREREGRVFQYCAHIRPNEWSTDTVRFVADGETHRLARLDFAWKGDTAGCVSKSGEPAECGSLTPNVVGFTYGPSALSYWSLGLGRAQSSYLGEDGNVIGRGAVRLRLSAYLPLLYLAIGSTKTLATSVEAGFAIPLTLASTPSVAGGSLMGLGFGPYWASCLVLRSTVAPRICAGVEVDGVLEGSSKGGTLDEIAPHVAVSWFLSVGLGAH